MIASDFCQLQTAPMQGLVKDKVEAGGQKGEDEHDEKVSI